MDLGKLAELSHHRVCQVCGAEFETNKEQTALQQFSDHSAIHNPSPAQWSEAYDKIQAGKERAKKQEKDPT